VSKFSSILTSETIQKNGGANAGPLLLTIPGVHLKSGYVSIGGPNSFSDGNRDEPLLIVDGVPYEMASSDTGTDLDLQRAAEGSYVMRMLSAIPSDIIDFIEVLKGPEAAMYGYRGGNGVIIVNTLSRSNIRSSYASIGTLKYTPKSYHVAPEFDMPDYSDQSIKNKDFADTRSTIYWNGHVYTDAKGKAELKFYTADAATTYTVTVTGITADGDIIYKKASFRRN
jgi:TonB-dependent SusC/RagA subfamily outer membrane receptor